MMKLSNCLKLFQKSDGVIILDKNVFDNLMKKIKVFEKKFSTLPIAGEQAKH